MATDTALRVTCSKSELASALGVVARAVSTRGAVQVLGGILLRAEEGRLTLAATDMEISLRSSLGGEVAGDASVVVPGRLLTDLVRLLPDDTVTLVHEEGDGVLSVTSGSHSSRLNVYSAEDFPRLPPLDVPLHRIEAGALLETIDKVGRAASRDESRPVLTGILVRFEGEKLVMAATDSYRLAVKETPLSAGGPDLEAIIPARALQELVRIAAGTEDVELGVHENHVIFRAGDVWLTSRRIDGQFPNYKQLLPETFEIEIDDAACSRCSRSFAAPGSWRSATLRSGSASRRASSPSRPRRRTSARQSSPFPSSSRVRSSRSASTRTSCATASRRWAATPCSSSSSTDCGRVFSSPRKRASGT